MSPTISKALSALTLLSSALALPTTPKLTPRTTYPFTKIVAYGDELSDNGNGSFAHGITGDPKTVYGFGTWTNGPVAVSYLSSLLSAPLTDYAFGSSGGGGTIGATFDNTYTPSDTKLLSGASAPSLNDQIANYSSTGYDGIKNSLQFIWVGQNDLSKHTDAFWEGDPQNSAFATAAANYTSAAVKKLVDAGAPYVFVANIYPKHLAPVTAKYLCGTDTGCVSTWGDIITAANTAIKDSLVQFGAKAIYYDTFAYVSSMLDDPTAYGFTKPLTDFCDGMGDATFADCMYDGNAGEYFWMNFVQPTTRAAEFIAEDMKKAIDSHLGM